MHFTSHAPDTSISPRLFSPVHHLVGPTNQGVDAEYEATEPLTISVHLPPQATAPTAQRSPLALCTWVPRTRGLGSVPTSLVAHLATYLTAPEIAALKQVCLKIDRDVRSDGATRAFIALERELLPARRQHGDAVLELARRRLAELGSEINTMPSASYDIPLAAAGAGCFCLMVTTVGTLVAAFGQTEIQQALGGMACALGGAGTVVGMCCFVGHAARAANERRYQEAVASRDGAARSLAHMQPIVDIAFRATAHANEVFRRVSLAEHEAFVTIDDTEEPQGPEFSSPLVAGRDSLP